MSQNTDEESDERVIGVVFDSLEDEDQFFSQFMAVSENNEERKIEGSPLQIETEKGTGNFELFFTIYLFKSQTIVKDVNAFQGSKYVDWALEHGWIENAIYQNGRNADSQEFLEEFVMALYA